MKAKDLGMFSSVIFATGSFFPITKSFMGNTNYFSDENSLWKGMVFLLLSGFSFHFFYKEEKSKLYVTIVVTFIWTIARFAYTYNSLVRTKREMEFYYQSANQDIKIYYNLLRENGMLKELVTQNEAIKYLQESLTIGWGFGVIFLGLLGMIVAYFQMDGRKTENSKIKIEEPSMRKYIKKSDNEGKSSDENINFLSEKKREDKKDYKNNYSKIKTGNRGIKRKKELYGSKNLYEILGIKIQAKNEQIEEAYRKSYEKLNLKLSESNKDSINREKKIIEIAYKTLIDPVSKKIYDKGLEKDKIRRIKNLFYSTYLKSPSYKKVLVKGEELKCVNSRYSELKELERNNFKNINKRKKLSFSHYDLLLLEKDADTKEIMEAYFEKKKSCNPETVEEYKKEWAKKESKLVEEAYQILSNPLLREKYDKQLEQDI